MLLAFVAVSWITVIVAGVPAIYECIEKLRDSNKLCIPCLRSKQQQSTGSSSQDPERQSDAKPRPFRGIVKKCEKLLNPLSDLQAVTGISIIVAGWAQIKTISYYHQQLIMAYWWLTLNSFLTSRAEYLGFGLNSQDKKKSKGERIWAFMRIMIKLSSCVLGLSFDGYIIVQDQTWDNYGSPCNRFKDGSSDIPWMIGVCFFCIALLSLLISLSCSLCHGKDLHLHLHYYNGIEAINKVLKERHRALSAELRSIGLQSASTPTLQRIIKQLGAYSRIGFSWICRCFWCLIVLWLSIWCYGDSFGLATWLVLVIFNIWKTYDVVSLRSVNQDIVQDKGGESRMGFGQILTLVMITSIIFNAVDIFCGKAYEGIVTNRC